MNIQNRCYKNEYNTNERLEDFFATMQTFTLKMFSLLFSLQMIHFSYHQQHIFLKHQCLFDREFFSRIYDGSNSQ